MRLMREARCYPATGLSGPEASTPVARAPRGDGCELFWILRAVVEGTVDTRTGYVGDIRLLDALLLDKVAPILMARRPALATAMIEAFAIAADHLPASTRLARLELHVSPFSSFSVTEGDRQMVGLTQSFEFSAAHRLYCDDLSEEENGRVFGKCSNVNGHGHNYRLEVTVRGTPDEKTGTIVELPALRRTVRERVIDQFDHKHLNLDCAAFSSLNPSVENIALVIWGRLEDAFDGCRLSNVRVWETPKTYAEYSGCP